MCPVRFDYKIGLLGGNGPIAGAFAVLMVAETLLKAGTQQKRKPTTQTQHIFSSARA